MTIEQARGVSSQLHLGASIANDRNIDKDFAILAKAAGNTIDALIAELEKAEASAKLWHDHAVKRTEEIDALKQQEPVAWLYQHKTNPKKCATLVKRMDARIKGAADYWEIPLYLAAGAQPEVVTWGVDWGTNGDRSCVSIVKQHADGTLEVVATECQPTAGAQPKSFAKLYKDEAQGIEIERLKMRIEAQERKPLTLDRLREIERNHVYSQTATLVDFARAIEQAHGIKDGKNESK